MLSWDVWLIESGATVMRDEEVLDGVLWPLVRDRLEFFREVIE